MKSSLQIQLIKKSFDFLLIIFCYYSQLSLINSQKLCLDKTIAPGERLIINSSLIPLNQTECYLNITIEANYKINITCSDGNVEKGCYVIETTTENETVGGVPYWLPFPTPAKSIATCKITRLKDSTPFFCEITSYEAPNCTCGRVPPGSTFGDGVAQWFEFPSLVSIESLHSSCIGTILTDRVVMTAAQCIENQTTSFKYYVNVGLDSIGYGIYYEVLDIIKHEGYKPKEEATNNIALLITKETMVFDYRAGTACLPFNITKTNLKGNSVITAGWRDTDAAWNMHSYMLKKVTYYFIDDTLCAWQFRNFNKSTHICSLRNGQLCKTNIGGPVYYIQNSRYYVVGIVVGTSECTITPQITLSVNPYIDWIQNSVKWAEFCEM